ncbi:hypothetical protein HPB47_016549 [Ixodes persulcatus]|uniref:Uncharacterized protein n=1 Tax=Ixodes persulcatus TaxID=34615 RepID=A0AC60QRK3_IXOPE|nr:hypothetical protein HPB47_016549 [Ixodes persulcatus]
MDIWARDVPLSGAVVKQKAKDFVCLLYRDDFKESSGLLHRSKARHEIVGKMVSGESASADAPEAAAWLEKEMTGVLMRSQPADVYNADETGFSFQMLQNRTLALKGDRCRGGKQSRLWITVLLCVNMNASDKRLPFIIGNSKKLLLQRRSRSSTFPTRRRG